MTNNNKQKNLRDQILNLRSLIDLREKRSDKPDKEGQKEVIKRNFVDTLYIVYWVWTWTMLDGQLE